MFKHKVLILLPLVAISLLLAQQYGFSADATLAGSPSQQYLPFIQTSVNPPQVKMELFLADLPTDTISVITNAGDERLFVAQRDGIIRIVQPNGTLLPTAFLNISEAVTIQNWEQGLLGLAFHPNYPDTPYFYVSYTEKYFNNVRLARFSVSANPNIANPTPTHLLSIPKTELLSLVHNGGDLHFGPDGYLYMAVGDGGPDPSYGSGEVPDPANNGHRTDVLLGKILRIDVDNKPENLPADCGGFSSYKIPADNPLVDGAGGVCDEIWMSGLRNPWRFSFHPQSGDMFLTDVGEWEWEEVNFIPAGSGGGQNFGWRCWEGSYNHAVVHPQIAPGCLPQNQYEFPIIEYGHTDGCSIVGGFVYRGQAYYRLRGLYLFGDFCTGKLWTLYRNSEAAWVLTAAGGTGFHLSTFGEGADGSLYAGEWKPYGPASVYKVTVP